MGAEGMVVLFGGEGGEKRRVRRGEKRCVEMVVEWVGRGNLWRVIPFLLKVESV